MADHRSAPDPYRQPAPGIPGQSPPGSSIPAYSGPPHVDPARLATFGGVLRPHRGHLLGGLVGLGGAAVIIAYVHVSGWGMLLTLGLAAVVLVAVVMFALTWRRMRFEVHGQAVHYHPAVGRMRILTPGDVAEILHLHLRTPGSKATEWATLLIAPGGRRVLALSTPLWPPAYLAPALAPLVQAGAALTVVDHPVKVRELDPRHAALLPWSRRNVGKLVGLIMLGALILTVISIQLET